MAALPSTEWRERPWTEAEAHAAAPFVSDWKRVGPVRHVFTHFSLALDIYESTDPPAGEGFWGETNALPSVFRKAAGL
jgi:A/G-specific adenine glycosylase